MRRYPPPYQHQEPPISHAWRANWEMQGLMACRSLAVENASVVGSAEEYSLHAQRPVIGGLIRRRPHSSVAPAPAPRLQRFRACSWAKEDMPQACQLSTTDFLANASALSPSGSCRPATHGHAIMPIHLCRSRQPLWVRREQHRLMRKATRRQTNTWCQTSRAHAWYFRSHATEGADEVQTTASYIYFLNGTGTLSD
jgi:hypothetical protein